MRSNTLESIVLLKISVFKYIFSESKNLVGICVPLLDFSYFVSVLSFSTIAVVSTLKIELIGARSPHISTLLLSSFLLSGPNCELFTISSSL